MRAAAIILLLVFGSTAVLGQEMPRVEVFAGYALFNAVVTDRRNFSGGELNLKINVRPAAALDIDAGGQYRSDADYVPPPDLSFFNFHDRYRHAYQLLLGPEFTRRGDESDLYVHVLAGLVHGIPRLSANNFGAVGLGGGFVYHRGKPFALRAGVDYIPNRGAGRTYNDIRLGAGVVWRIR